jgi:arylsulfatase A-like enzyme
MDDASPWWLATRGAVTCAAVGTLVGALETLPFALTVRVDLSIVEAAVRFGALGLMYAVSGVVIGFGIGIPVHVVMRRLVVARGMAVQVGLTSGVLLFGLFTGLAERSLEDGRGGVAGVMLVMPLLLMMTVFLLVSRLYRERRRAPEGLALGAAVVGACLLAGASLGLRSSMEPPTRALSSDPRVLIIAVDAMREDLDLQAMPRMRELISGGVRFRSAITPNADTASAIASIQTGLSPLRHEVLTGGDRLRRVRGLLSATFQEEGYRTAAFVSRRGLSSSLGFEHGFDVYDDELGGMGRGWSRLRPVALLTRALFEPRASRDDDETVGRFVDWASRVQGEPFFAMVHLGEPRDVAAGEAKPAMDSTDVRLAERAYREALARTDARIGRVMEAVAHSRERLLVVVVGTGGQSFRDTEPFLSAVGVDDAVVKVPLVLAGLGLTAGEVTADVRTFDLYATLLEFAELRPRHESESIDLTHYLTGKRSLPLPVVVSGWDPGRREWAVALRSNGAKFVLGLEGGEALFDLDEDPHERTDVREQMPETVDQARRVLEPERLRLRELLSRREHARAK